MRAQEFIAESTATNLAQKIATNTGLDGSNPVYSKLAAQSPQQSKPQNTKQSNAVQIKPITDRPLEKLLLNIAQTEYSWSPVELAQFMAQCAHETMNFQKLEEFGTPQYFKRRYGSDRYKGRGFIQLTGKDNYKQYNLHNKPQAAAEPNTAAKIAASWWKNNVAKRLDDFSNTSRVTRIINGPGMYGLDEREDYFDKYLQAWNVKGVTA